MPDQGDQPYEPSRVDITTAPDPSAGRGFLIAVVALLIINLYLLVGVVPKFKTMFDALKGELPYVTQLLLALSNFTTNNLVIILGLVGIAGWFAFKHAARIPVAANIILVVVLSGAIAATPMAIFYPILQLQSAIRGDQPPAEQPVEEPRTP